MLALYVGIAIFILAVGFILAWGWACASAMDEQDRKAREK